MTTDETPVAAAPAKKKPKGFIAGLVLGAVLGCLSGCVIGFGLSDKSSTDAEPAQSAANAADAAATPPVPAHSWTSREGQEYAYESVLSDDDKKAGKAAADVYLYRYLGKNDGVFSVQTESGDATVTSSCTDPCKIVKVQSQSALGTSVRRVSFATDSIIGAVLTDAMKGEMEIYRPTEPAQ